ncbi:hypothetical protein DZF79_04635 [Vibrio parahaemolyticus]|nr:hypothetical protein [Vibrio parahaemolyticus]
MSKVNQVESITFDNCGDEGWGTLTILQVGPKTIQALLHSDYGAFGAFFTIPEDIKSPQLLFADLSKTVILKSLLDNSYHTNDSVAVIEHIKNIFERKILETPDESSALSNQKTEVSEWVNQCGVVTALNMITSSSFYPEIITPDDIVDMSEMHCVNPLANDIWDNTISPIIEEIKNSRPKSYQEVSFKYNAMKVKDSNTLS